MAGNETFANASDEEESISDVEEMKISVPWGFIAAKCWYSASAKPVLVLHGLNENAGSFDRLVPLLPKNYYYVVVDLPGHGFSSPFPGGVPLSFMNYLHQIHLVVNHFRWRRLILIGHSFGGHIAEFYAATFRSKVEKLILLESWSPMPVAKDLYLVSYLNQMRDLKRNMNRKPKCYTYAEALSSAMNDRWTKLNVNAAAALLRRSLRTTDEGYVFVTDCRTRWEIKPELDEETLMRIFRDIKCPVLVVLGSDSELRDLQYSWEFIRAVLQVLEKSHPLSRITRVDGNHCLHNNNPEVVAPIIANFLFDTKSNL